MRNEFPPRGESLKWGRRRKLLYYWGWGMEWNSRITANKTIHLFPRFLWDYDRRAEAFHLRILICSTKNFYSFSTKVVVTGWWSPNLGRSFNLAFSSARLTYTIFNGRSYSIYLSPLWWAGTYLKPIPAVPWSPS